MADDLMPVPMSGFGGIQLKAQIIQSKPESTVPPQCPDISDDPDTCGLRLLQVRAGIVRTARKRNAVANFFRLVHAQSGMCVHTQGTRRRGAVILVTGPCEDKKSQLRMVPSGNKDATYHLQSRSGRACANLKGSDTTTNLTWQSSCDAEQTFLTSPTGDGDGSFFLKEGRNGRCLHMAEPGNATAKDPSFMGSCGDQKGKFRFRTEVDDRDMDDLDDEPEPDEEDLHEQQDLAELQDLAEQKAREEQEARAEAADLAEQRAREEQEAKAEAQDLLESRGAELKEIRSEAQSLATKRAAMQREAKARMRTATTTGPWFCSESGCGEP